MKYYIVELDNGNFETILADNLEDAEEQANDMFGFDHLEVYEEQ